MNNFLGDNMVGFLSNCYSIKFFSQTKYFNNYFSHSSVPTAKYLPTTCLLVLFCMLYPINPYPSIAGSYGNAVGVKFATEGSLHHLQVQSAMRETLQ